MTNDEGLGGLTPEEQADLEALQDPSRPAREIEAIRRRVVASPRMSEALYEDEALRVALRKRRKVVPIAPWMRVALPVAAGVLVVLASIRTFDRGAGGSGEELQSGRLRSGTGAPVVTGLHPVGSFRAAPTDFVWTSDARATAYRLEIRDAAGGVLFSATTPDTALTADLSSLVGAEGLVTWRVVPLHGAVESEPSRDVPMNRQGP